jgi:excisionase family DNA binding protein
MRLNAELVAAMERDGYVTTTEAARLTKHPSSTIRFWCQCKGLAHIRDGSAFFINRESLLRMAGRK